MKLNLSEFSYILKDNFNFLVRSKKDLEMELFLELLISKVCTKIPPMI